MSIASTVQEINDYIRFFLGDIGQDVVSDEVLNKIIQHNIDKGIYTDCQVIYYSTVDLLNWLNRRALASGGEGGELKKRKEKEGNVTIEEEYVEGSDSSWSIILADLLANPDSIGCIVHPTTESNNSSVIIGGVSKKEAERVNSNPDSRNMYNTRSPFKTREPNYATRR